MKNETAASVPRMTEVAALAEANKRWGDTAWVLRHSNYVCVSGGKGSKAYGEAANFEEAFAAADRQLSEQAAKAVTNDCACVFIAGQEPGKRIRIVRYLDCRYYPPNADDTSMSDEAAVALVDIINAQLGVPPDVAESMHIGSLGSWRAPGARRALEFFGPSSLVEKMGTWASTATVPLAVAVVESMFASKRA